MSEEQNFQLSIDVETTYIDEQSDPENDRFVFAYTIIIRNTGTVAAKLISRHWIITDANNYTQEVKGEGVVGEQPHLSPGEGFQYTSGTVLDTPIGSMHGSYQMVSDDGEEFDAEIPMFTLSRPNALH